jgi:isoaspartyl peptidase/L-asparaginase-like protein (Ntn-hydrolase superfamily)
MTVAIIVHGGASPVPPEQADAYRSGCTRALQAGWAVLKRGGGACDAFEAAVRAFEDDETFNAARGGRVMTGTGEAIMQVVLAKTVTDMLAEGLHPDEAAQRGMNLLGERVSGEGGCIVLDHQGRFGWAHNSADMPCAVMSSDLDAPRVWLKKG